MPNSQTVKKVEGRIFLDRPDGLKRIEVVGGRKTPRISTSTGSCGDCSKGGDNNFLCCSCIKT